jgi:hypothetical protein
VTVAPRTKQTQAHVVFVANLDRARAFLRIFDKDRGVGQPSNDEKELLRGSLVFAVGALDAYLSELVLEIVPEHGPKSKQLTEGLKAIARSDPSLSLRVALAGTEADRKAEFRSALDEWLATKSFQGPEKVMAALSYVACALEWHVFDAATDVDTAAQLHKITKDRHEIVHNGKKPYIKRKMAGDTNDLIAKIERLIDDEVCTLY